MLRFLSVNKVLKKISTEEEMQTHRDNTMGLDVINPETVIHEVPCSPQQLLQLVQGERSHQVPDMYDIGDWFSGWGGRPPGGRGFIWLNQWLRLADSSNNFGLCFCNRSLHLFTSYKYKTGNVFLIISSFGYTN